jgi:hypothetical protein
MDTEELPEQIKEQIAHSLVPLMMKLMKENGIECKLHDGYGEPVPLYDFMLKNKREDGTIPYIGHELTQKS